MIISFKWITGFLRTGQTYLSIMVFPEYFYYQEVMPAVTIQLHEQRLKFSSIWSYCGHKFFCFLFCFVLIAQHPLHLLITSDVSWNHLSLFSVRVVQMG